MAGRHARPSRAQARAGAFALQRQAVSPRARRRRLERIRRSGRSALGVAAAVGAALTLGVLGSGGTYALWQHDAPIIGDGLNSGTVGLEFEPATITTAHVEALNLLPLESQATAIQLRNSGTADLEITATIDDVDPSFEVRLAIDTPSCTPGALTGPAFTSPETALDLGVLDGETSATLCVQITATTDALPGDGAEFQIVLQGETLR